MDDIRTIQQNKYLIVCVILLISGLIIYYSISRNNDVKMITEYYRFDGTALKYSDTIMLKKNGINYEIHISNDKRKDTNFVINTTDAQLFLLNKSTKVMTHEVKENKMVKSKVQSTFFTPYLTNNSVFQAKKIFKIENNEYAVYRYLENILDDNGYSYYLKNVGFIAYINTKSEYYWVIKEISNSAYLSDSHREKLIKSLKDDTVFFKNKRYVPPIPNEFR